MRSAWVEPAARGWLLHFGDREHGLLFMSLDKARIAATDWAAWARPARVHIVQADGSTEELEFRGEEAG